MPFSYIIGSTVRENGRKGKCMKAAIIKRTCIVLIVALLISGVISGMVCYRQFRREIQEEMVDVLQVIDVSLDRDKDTGAQLLQYRQAMERKYRITLIAADGTVLADTNVSNVQTMENHLARPEIQEAKRKGVGYENRSSDTFVTSMFYVALYSPEHGDFLRLALESAALGQVLAMTVQVFIFSALAALFLAVFLTNRLARSITDPLMEISREMSGFGAEGKVFHFRTFPYRELNVIADTTTSMSKNVRDYLQKLEKEKQVRQEFFSNASHELKTPLTAIRGYTELLQSGMAADPAAGNKRKYAEHGKPAGLPDRGGCHKSDSAGGGRGTGDHSSGLRAGGSIYESEASGGNPFQSDQQRGQVQPSGRKCLRRDPERQRYTLYPGRGYRNRHFRGGSAACI